MPIATAIAGVASVGSAVIGANASKSAADAQVAAQQNALNSQNANFNSALDFQKANYGTSLDYIKSLTGGALDYTKGTFDTAKGALNPYVQSGTSVLPKLQSLLTPGPSQTDVLSKLPGFQFQSQYGTMATTNALAARGLGGSTGPLARGISDYNQGLAGTSFQSLVNALQSYGNMGLGAATSLAGSAGNAGSTFGNITSGGNAAVANLTGNVNNAVGSLTGSQNNTIGTTNTNIGTANAAGILGQSNALQSGVNSIGNLPVNAMLLNKFLSSGTSGASPTNSNGIYGSSVPSGFSGNSLSSLY
jgi:hypothetical protein